MSMTFTAKGTLSTLPSPKFGDQEALTDEVDVKRAHDGSVYTYVIVKDRRKYQWEFSLSREKGLEILAFAEQYNSDTVTVVDHKDRTIVGNFSNNPWEFDTDSRGLVSITQNVRNEMMNIAVEFEGIEQ